VVPKLFYFVNQLEMAYKRYRSRKTKTQSIKDMIIADLSRAVGGI